MKSPKSKEQLIETVIKQLEVDVHCNDLQAIEELLGFIPVENLIAYLPEEDWKPFKHLVAEDYLKKEDSTEEIRTENAIRNLVNQYGNDQELGKEIRKRWLNYTTP